MNPDGERLRETAEAHTTEIARHQDEREASMRAVLASSATYIALMSAAVTSRAPTHPDQLRAGQFLLSLLFAAVLAFYATAIYQRSRDIADEGVRRLLLELDHPTAVQERERLAYSFGSRDWRRSWKLPLPVLAALPRWGKSLQHGFLLLVLCGVLPAAWFSLSRPRSMTMDAAVAIATFFVFMLCVRAAMAGCRHWFWVDARDLTLRGSPNETRAPAWTWWIEAARQPRNPPLADLAGPLVPVEQNVEAEAGTRAEPRSRT